MEKKLKSLEIVFENVDSIEVPAKGVLGVNLQDITQGLTVYQDMLEGIYVAKSVLLKLDVASLSKVYDTFEDEDGVSRLINFQDIVCLLLHTEDGHETEVYVDWNEDKDGQHNSYQTSEIVKAPFDDFDSLFVAIGKDTEIPEWLGEDDE